MEGVMGREMVQQGLSWGGEGVTGTISCHTIYADA